MMSSLIKSFLLALLAIISAIVYELTGERIDLGIVDGKVAQISSSSVSESSVSSISVSSAKSSSSKSSLQQNSSSSHYSSSASSESVFYDGFEARMAGADEYDPKPGIGEYDRKPGDFVGLNDLDEQFELAKRFSMAEIGDYKNEFDPQKISYFHRSGTKIYGYEWLVAKYHYTDGGEDDEFTKWLLARPETRTLNPDGYAPHCTDAGWDWCREVYIDYGNKRVFDRRVDDVADAILSRGLTGVFFDWGNSLFLEENRYASIYDAWREKHPNLEYKEAISNYYAKLRERGIEVFSNQAFRDGDVLVKNVDYDMSESDMSTDMYSDETIDTDRYGRIDSAPYTEFYWYDDRTFYDLADRLRTFEKYAKKYASRGFKGTVFVNYAAPLFVENGNGYRVEIPKNAIYFNHAFAKMINAREYTEIPYDRSMEGKEGSEIYFADLGEPLDDTFHKIDDLDEAYIRFYKKGFVFVTNTKDGVDPLYVTVRSGAIPKNAEIYDLYSNETLRSGPDGSVTFKIDFVYDPIVGDNQPSGRIFLYGKR